MHAVVHVVSIVVLLELEPLTPVVAPLEYLQWKK